MRTTESFRVIVFWIWRHIQPSTHAPLNSVVNQNWRLLGVLWRGIKIRAKNFCAKLLHEISLIILAKKIFGVRCNLSNWKEEAWKNQGFSGIRTRDLREYSFFFPHTFFLPSYKYGHFKRNFFCGTNVEDVAFPVFGFCQEQLPWPIAVLRFIWVHHLIRMDVPKTGKIVPKSWIQD